MIELGKEASSAISSSSSTTTASVVPNEDTTVLNDVPVGNGNGPVLAFTSTLVQVSHLSKGIVEPSTLSEQLARLIPVVKKLDTFKRFPRLHDAPTGPNRCDHPRFR